ncbi:MAG: peptidylprolyl isomerase [Candidatus Latescibacterota bacterium]|nr:MAG: peptidylprolyl isomerase [Candidatus Latescibacterota bacterium]
MLRKTIYLMMLSALVLLAGCGSSDEKADKSEDTATNEPVAEQRVEPDFVTVQHILIAFEGTLPNKDVTRTRDEAAKLAEELLEKAKSGADFDALVKEYTDDQHPGIYTMANLGVQANPAQEVYPRARMVKSFGDVGFSLEVGEVGVAVFDPAASKYGWHIIKRVE